MRIQRYSERIYLPQNSSPISLIKNLREKTHPRKNTEPQNKDGPSNPRQLREKTWTINKTHSTCKTKRNKTRTNTQNPKTYRTNNTYTGKPPQKKNDCRFCGQQNWSPLHKRPAKTTEWNKCHEIGHFARVCHSNTENARKRMNHIGETYNDEEEESETEDIQQITQINRILPDKSDYYEIKMKINGKYQKFTIDTGSPVTIIPNNPELYNQKDIQLLKEKYWDVNINEIKFLEKVWADIEYNGEITKLPILITQWNDITPLLDVNWLKQLAITINKILLDEPTKQSSAIQTKFHKLFVTNHTIKNTEVKNPKKTRMALDPTKSRTDTIPTTTRRKERTWPINKIRTPWNTTNNRRRLFCITRSSYGKERPNGKNRNGRHQTKRELCEKKTTHAKHEGTTKPNIRRAIEKWPRFNLDIRHRPRLRQRTNETSIGNQQTLQLHSYRQECERILPIPKGILRSCRHTNHLSRKIRQNVGTPNARMTWRHYCCYPRKEGSRHPWNEGSRHPRNEGRTHQ